MKFLKAKKPKAEQFVVFISVMTVVTVGILAYSKRGSISILDFRKNENIQVSKTTGITYADPVDIFSAMKKKGEKKIVLIDIRNEKAYKEKYIRGSINVPFNSTKVGGFSSSIKEKANGKQIVILPHSSFTTRGEQAIRELEKSGQHASLLKVGWNELYNLPNLWLPEEEWESFRFQDMIEHAEVK